MKVPFMKKIGIVLSLGLLIGFVGCKTNTTEDITLTEIKLDTTKVKTEFTVDETFTTDELVVTAVYSDGTTKKVTGWTTSGFDSSAPVESQEITVSYTENGITKTATYKITIKAKAEGGNTGGEGGNTGGEGGNTGGEGGNTGGEGGSENPPATNVAYKVEHYQQNIADNNYTLVTADTENKTGTALSDTAAVAKTYTGFTAKTFAQKKIAADGSTVVKIYYDRNSYTIKFDTDGGTEINDITLKFGATVTAPENPTKTGFVFEKWDAAIPATMPAANITFKASWTPATNTAYKVKHYQQNIADNNYTLVTADTENKTGTTLSDTAAVAKTYTGFTAKTFAQEKIAADGSTEVEIYYDRNSYTLKFDTDGGTKINDIILKFGATVTTPENPTKTGFVFEKWDAAIPATMPAENLTFKASWKKIESAFDVTLDKNNEIQLTYTSTKTNEICFTAPEGYVSYKWYCDGEEIIGLEDKNQNVCRIATDKMKTENPFSRAELLPYFKDGKHEILVIVKDSNGVYNSAKATFYVYN